MLWEAPPHWEDLIFLPGGKSVHIHGWTSQSVILATVLKDSYCQNPETLVTLSDMFIILHNLSLQKDVEEKKCYRLHIIFCEKVWRDTIFGISTLKLVRNKYLILNSSKLLCSFFKWSFELMVIKFTVLDYRLELENRMMHPVFDTAMLFQPVCSTLNHARCLGYSFLYSLAWNTVHIAKSALFTSLFLDSHSQRNITANLLSFSFNTFIKLTKYQVSFSFCNRLLVFISWTYSLFT